LHDVGPEGGQEEEIGMVEARTEPRTFRSVRHYDGLQISRMTLPDSYRQQGHKRFVVDIWIVVSNKVQQSGNCLSVSLIMKVTTFLADRATNLLNINRFKPWKSQDNEICCLERERLNWKIKFCFNQG